MGKTHVPDPKRAAQSPSLWWGWEGGGWGTDTKQCQAVAGEGKLVAWGQLLTGESGGLFPELFPEK